MKYRMVGRRWARSEAAIADVGVRSAIADREANSIRAIGSTTCELDANRRGL